MKQGVDGVPVAEICRKAGISQPTYFNWKKKYSGPPPDGMRRLKQLEHWGKGYNEVRPHSAIGCNVPIALHNPGGATGPPL